MTQMIAIEIGYCDDDGLTANESARASARDDGHVAETLHPFVVRSLHEEPHGDYCCRCASAWWLALEASRLELQWLLALSWVLAQVQPLS